MGNLKASVGKGEKSGVLAEKNRAQSESGLGDRPKAAFFGVDCHTFLGEGHY